MKLEMLLLFLLLCHRAGSIQEGAGRKRMGVAPGLLASGLLCFLPCFTSFVCPPGTLICGEGCLRHLPRSECPPDDGTALAFIEALPNCTEAKVGQLCEADGECGTRIDFDNCGSDLENPMLQITLWDIYQKIPPEEAECSDALDEDTGLRVKGSSLVDSVCSDLVTLPPCSQLMHLCGHHYQVDAYCPKTCGECATCADVADECRNTYFGVRNRTRSGPPMSIPEPWPVPFELSELLKRRPTPVVLE